MSENFCQYVTHWPEHQDEHSERCGAPAAIRHSYESFIGDGRKHMWVCAEHYDKIRAALDQYNVPEF